jgi:plastocyanin
MFRRAGLAALVVLMLSTGSVFGATSMVKMKNNYFTPKTQGVTIGNSVKWKNPSSKRHDATPMLNWSWNSVSVPAGGVSAAVTPTQAGSFGYFCSLHPGMTGTLNVRMGVSPLVGTTSTWFNLTLGTVNAPGVLIHQVETRQNASSAATRRSRRSRSTDQDSSAIWHSLKVVPP